MNGTSLPFSLIVISQASPQPARFNPDNGASLRILKDITLKDVLGDGEALDERGPARQGLVDHVTQKLLQPQGAREVLACKNTIEFDAHRFGVNRRRGLPIIQFH